MYMCNDVPEQVYSPRHKERALVLVRARPGHRCGASFAVVAIAVWRALPASKADKVWLFLKEDVVEKPGFTRTVRSRIERGYNLCGCNDGGSACIIPGCFGHPILNICSNRTRENRYPKVPLDDYTDPELVGRARALLDMMHGLSDDVGQLYKSLARNAFEMQVSRLADAPSCQMGT